MNAQNNSHFASLKCPQCGAGLPVPETETVTCQYCGTHLIRQPASENTRAASSHPFVRGVRFVPCVCNDVQGTGMEAFRLLIPAGWQTRGGVQWQSDNPGMPAVIAYQVWNPQGVEAFEIFPNLSFYWTNNPMSMLLKPVGSHYYGNEVRPPMPALQMLREIMLPHFRNMRDVSIKNEVHLPNLPAQLKAGNPYEQNPMVQSDGAKIRITYPMNTVIIEEEIFGVVEVTRVATPGLFGPSEMIFWCADYLFSFRALDGKLDISADIFKTIISSFTLNMQWYFNVSQISQYMIQNQIQHIHNIGQISRSISQTYHQISDMMMQGFNQRQQIMDSISENFSQSIRGVDAYFDPNKGNNIELPTGYTNAWSNPLGEYIITDDPNYNPNIFSNQSWTPMERQD